MSSTFGGAIGQGGNTNSHLNEVCSLPSLKFAHCLRRSYFRVDERSFICKYSWFIWCYIKHGINFDYIYNFVNIYW